MSGSDSDMEFASIKSGTSYKSRSSINSGSSNKSTPVSDCFRLRDATTQIQKTELLIRTYRYMLKSEKPEEIEMNKAFRPALMEAIAKKDLC
ncbi:hypothetical protein TNCV_2285101 [Trichonephila clavipes]|nr:hypothetical protein TNCV_2285101 [Trichonephila clavipes]